MARVLAAADIGSNTAHLLVAEHNAGRLRRVVNDSEWLSLGEVVTREGKIPEPQTLKLVQVIREFRRLSESHKAEKLYVFATEAMRRAENCPEVLERVKKEAGVAIDLIAPAKEAELGHRGALIDTKPLNPHLMVETGGGSVQAAWCRGHEVKQDVSLPIGTGVLIAHCDLSYPARESQVDRMRLHIHEALEGALDEYAAARSIIACGGVARGIWRALHPDGERVIHIRELSYLAWDSARLSQQQIVERYGVKPKRAVTLLPGALIYESILKRFGMEEFEVSQFGVREGAILEMASVIEA